MNIFFQFISYVALVIVFYKIIGLVTPLFKKETPPNPRVLTPEMLEAYQLGGQAFLSEKMLENYRFLLYNPYTDSVLRSYWDRGYLETKTYYTQLYVISNM